MKKMKFFAENGIFCKECNILKFLQYIKNKTDVERRQTLGHPKSINPNMINHVPQQSPLIF